jgi:hypothetical protein
MAASAGAMTGVRAGDLLGSGLPLGLPELTLNLTIPGSLELRELAVW